jgi:2-polyprenyl-6-methoxyphenol hydroxylase-like FAD-dependent oxidoreductase
MCTVNWIAELDRRAFGMTSREDWNRRGNFNDFMPHFEDWVFDWLDIPAMCRQTDTAFEFPMIDRDPLDRWTFGHVTLLGDAAHPMYPIGSNGASQAIIDGLVLADSLAEESSIEAALARYEGERRPRTSQIVLSNRKHGPERVMDMAQERAPQGFTNVDEVFAPGELEEVAAQYRQLAGFDLASILKGGK